MSKKLTPANSPLWSEIPSEILEKIGDLTDSPLNKLQFRAVCHSWRLSFSPLQNRGSDKYPLKIPDLSVPGFLPFDLRISKSSLHVVPTRSFVIEPTKGSFKGSSMLITADEINPGFLSHRYPLLASHCRSLSVGNRSKCLDLLKTRVILVDCGFSVRPLSVRRNASEKDDGWKALELSHNLRDKSWKAVVYSNSCCEDDLLVLVLCYGGALMSLRVRDEKWKAVVNGEVSQFADIVMFKDQIYGIDCLGRAFFVDYDFGLGELKIFMVAPNVETGDKRGKRLVVDSSSGRLYMVVREIADLDFSFLVYRLNEGLGVWNKVKSIGNQMFFVGTDFSFCTRSQDFPGLSMSCMYSQPRNCIFFSKGSFPGFCYGSDGDNLLFGKNIDGTGMNIGQFCLGGKCATGLLESAYYIMFSLPI